MCSCRSSCGCCSSRRPFAPIPMTSPVSIPTIPIVPLVPVTTNIVGLGPVVFHPLLPAGYYGSRVIFSNGSLVVPNLPRYNVAIQIQGIIVDVGPNVYPPGTTVQAIMRLRTNACNQVLIVNTNPAVPVGTPLQFAGFGRNVALTPGAVLSAELELRLSNNGAIYSVQLANPSSGSYIIIGSE